MCEFFHTPQAGHGELSLPAKDLGLSKLKATKQCRDRRGSTQPLARLLRQNQPGPFISRPCCKPKPCPCQLHHVLGIVASGAASLQAPGAAKVPGAFAAGANRVQAPGAGVYPRRSKGCRQPCAATLRALGAAKVAGKVAAGAIPVQAPGAGKVAASAAGADSESATPFRGAPAVVGES